MESHKMPWFQSPPTSHRVKASFPFQGSNSSVWKFHEHPLFVDCFHVKTMGFPHIYVSLPRVLNGFAQVTPTPHSGAKPPIAQQQI